LDRKERKKETKGRERVGGILRAVKVGMKYWQWSRVALLSFGVALDVEHEEDG